jgi:hypothetical protein
LWFAVHKDFIEQRLGLDRLHPIAAYKDLLTFFIASTGDWSVEVELKRVFGLSKRCERGAVDALLLLPLDGY